jgi:hypothetical protein
MKTLNEYIKESLLDDFDDLDKDLSTAAIAHKLKKFMMEACPIYKHKFEMNFDNFYIDLNKEVLLENIPYTYLYTFVHNNKLYVLPTSPDILRHDCISDASKKMFIEFAEFIDDAGITFYYSENISSIYVDESVKNFKGKLSYNINFEDDLSITALYIPELDQLYIDFINNVFKIKNIISLDRYGEYVIFDLSKDLKFPFDLRVLHIYLPIKIGSQQVKYKTTDGILSYQPAYDLLDRIFTNNPKLYKIAIHKSKTAKIEKSIIKHQTTNTLIASKYF